MKKLIHKNTFVFAVFVLFCCLLYGQVINQAYFFIDESEYIKIKNPELPYFNHYEEKSADFGTFLGFQEKYINHGRFKVVGVGLQWIWAHFFGHSPLVLKTSVLLVTIFSCFLFFLFLKNLRINQSLSVLAGLLLMSGYYSEIWFRVGPYEAIGFLFLISALYLYQQSLIEKNTSFLYGSYFFLFLSMHCKESYWILLPAIFIAFVGLNQFYHQTSFTEAFQTMKKTGFVFMAFFLSFAIGLIWVYQTAPRLYGFQENDQVFPVLKNNILSLLGNYYLLIPCLFAFALKPKYRIYFLMLFVLWYAGQLFINLHNWINPSTRYLFPAQGLLLFLSILGTHSLLNQYKWAKALSFSFFILILLVQSKNSFSNASSYAARSKLWTSACEVISKENPETVTLITEPYSGNEPMDATRILLSYFNYNQKVSYEYILPKKISSANEKTGEYFVKLKQSETLETKVKNLNTPQKTYACIYFLHPSEDIRLNPLSIDTNQYKVVSLEQEYFQFSWKNMLRLDVKQKLHNLVLIKKE